MNAPLPADLVSLLNHPRISRPEAVHDRECRYWREGKGHGPCTCGARELDTQLRAALIASGVDVSETPNQERERLEAISESVSAAGAAGVSVYD